jgi:hypothetical protein
MTWRAWALVFALTLLPFSVGNLTGFFVLPRVILHFLAKPAPIESVATVVPVAGFPAEHFDDKPRNYAPAPKDAPPSPIAIGPYRWSIRYFRMGPGSFAVSYPKATRPTTPIEPESCC